MAVTILDVAKEAGVSIGTVSRYMADPEQVNKVNQKNIAKAIEKLEFIPNNYARHLKRGTTNIVGFITPDITQELFNKVAKALNQILIEYGYLLIICDSEESPKKEKQLINTLLQQNAALIIIASSGQNEKFLATAAEKNPKKIMLFDRMVPGVPTECLCEDNEYNAYKLVNNLIIHDVLKDSQYVVLSGTDYSPITHYRLQGVKKAFKEHNIVLDDEKVIKNLCTTAKTKEIVLKLLSSPSPPRVIIFTNPKCIFGILQACWQLHINIGEELKIAGFSSTSIRTQFNIDAPCVIQDSQEIGRRLGNFAVARIKNPQNTIIPKTIYIDSLVEDIYPIKQIKEHTHDFTIISPKN